MSSKDLFGKIGMAVVIFILLLFVLDARGPGIWAEVDPNAGAKDPLEMLWQRDFLVTATILQAFTLFAALLAINLQFAPVTGKKGDDH
ncbi:MAG: hypothetical protein ACXACI_17935 [Candidatus Hodarchaeales archaeon]|jgi:hypothetical protein